MSTKKPRILVVGAGISGLTAANKLYTSSDNAFDIQVAEGGERIGGRIRTSTFCGDTIETGATWIHGIQGSPVYDIAKRVGSLESTTPWECMDGSYGGSFAVVENGYELDFHFVECVSKYFDVLMCFAQGKGVRGNGINNVSKEIHEIEQNGVIYYSEMANNVSKEKERNGMSYCEMAKRVDEIKDIEQNGVKCCEMCKRGEEMKENEQNGMDYCEMGKRVSKIKGIVRNGMSYWETDEKACENIGVEQNGVEICKTEKKICEIKEFEQNGMNYCELTKRAYEIEVFEQKRAYETKEKEQNGMILCEMAKKVYEIKETEQNGVNYWGMAKRAYEICLKDTGFEKISIGSYLIKGLELYKEKVKGLGKFDQESILEAIFEMKGNTQRTYTSADDLTALDFEAEREYILFPGEEITIAKGYMSIIESLASVLPHGCVKLGKKVTKIEWRSDDHAGFNREVSGEIRAVKVNFSDGSYMYADHVILTVSLGVLKYGVCEKTCMFDPPLPSFKVDAILRLGYGVVNKLFMELRKESDDENFPFLQMAFHKLGSKSTDPKIPLWMRRTNSICPIYGKSNVLLSWFAGKEALELESLKDEEIIEGVSNTLSCFTTKSKIKVNSNFGNVLKTQWGNDPLFLGSYSYVAVGSSCDDLDTMAMSLPENAKNGIETCFPFQILFAGEATHRTHYSTTHGAYFSGLREANRLLQHYGL